MMNKSSLPSSEPKSAPKPAENDDSRSSPSSDQDDDKEDDNAPPPPIGNGGKIDGKYTWTQTLLELNVTIPLPENTRGRDLNVTISKKHLKVGLKSQSPKYIINAPLVKNYSMRRFVLDRRRRKSCCRQLPKS